MFSSWIAVQMPAQWSKQSELAIDPKKIKIKNKKKTKDKKI